MDTNGANESRQDGQPSHSSQHGEAGDARHSGEGAASALAQLKNQNRLQRRHTDDEDRHAGPGS
jgi:hypothetical protein